MGVRMGILIQEKFTFQFMEIYPKWIAHALQFRQKLSEGAEKLSEKPHPFNEYILFPKAGFSSELKALLKKASIHLENPLLHLIAEVFFLWGFKFE